MFRNFGVHMHRSLNVAECIETIISKIYGILGFINGGINDKSRKKTLNLYEVLVRPQLIISATSGQRILGGMKALERMQKKFTRMVPRKRDFSFKVMLQKRRLFSLVQSRLRDFTVRYNITGLNKKDKWVLFQLADATRNRGYIFTALGNRYTT